MPFCSNMARPRGCHTEWNVRHKKTNTIWYRLSVESFLKVYKWTYLQNRNRVTDVENKFMVPGGQGGGEGQIGRLGSPHTHYMQNTIDK